MSWRKCAHAPSHLIRPFEQKSDPRSKAKFMNRGRRNFPTQWLSGKRSAALISLSPLTHNNVRYVFLWPQFVLRPRSPTVCHKFGGIKRPGARSLNCEIGHWCLSKINNKPTLDENLSRPAGSPKAVLHLWFLPWRLKNFLDLWQTFTASCVHDVCVRCACGRNRKTSLVLPAPPAHILILWKLMYCAPAD